MRDREVEQIIKDRRDKKEKGNASRLKRSINLAGKQGGDKRKR